MVLLSLLACVASILPEYESAKSAALADPGSAPASWSPDVVVQVAGPVVEDVLRAAIRAPGPLRTELRVGPVTVTPEVRLKTVRIVPARPCDGGCVGLDASFEGEIAWAAGPVKGTAPVSASGAVDAGFDVVRDGDDLVVRAIPRHLRDLSVEVAGQDAAIQRAARAWIEAEALTRLPPVTVARFARGGLPVRVARVAAAGDGVTIEALTDAPTTGSATAGPVPADGFAATLSQPTLLALAREAAFRQGTVGYGVVPEPTSLALGADGFTLGLRLWRIEGRTWWRDYVVTGTARVVDGRLKLAPTDVAEGEKSPGAALADPLAALGEGLILRTVEDAVQTSIPLRGQEKIGAAPVSVRLTGLAPAGDAIRVTGSVAVGRVVDR
jgi:hypothetical protein